MNILKYLKPKNMKSRKLLSLTALCALGMSFAACSSDDPVINTPEKGAPDKPCGVGRADANPKLLLNDT